MFQASHSDPKCSVWLSLFLTSGNLFLVAFLAQSLLCGPYVCWPNKTGVYLPMSEARFLQILLGGHLRGSRVLLVEREKERASRFWEGSQHKPPEGSPRCWTFLGQHLGLREENEVWVWAARRDLERKTYSCMDTETPQNYSNTLWM